MSLLKRILFFFVLPILGILLFEPSMFASGLTLIGIMMVFLITIGFFLWRGSLTALTFVIFVSGMNVIVRLMLILSNTVDKNGVFNPTATIFTFTGLIISFYLMLRLDQEDVRQYMMSKSIK
jgi:hypothetical protein